MILLLLAALAVPAAAESSLLMSRPAAALVNEVIELRPVDGHHFNVEAPQKCGGEKALEVLPRRLRCQLTKPGAASILVSVCDDALTFCRQESFDVKVAGAAKEARKSSPIKAAPKGGKGAPDGFIDNEPARARALARREGRLLLIDFYGIWCPPCNQLEEEAYPDPAFRAAAVDFVRLGLDADAPASFDWKARFKVGGYPTLIVADADLNELGRVVGSRSGPSLARFLNDVAAYKNEPVEAAAALVAKGGPQATELRRLRVAHWHVERGEFDAVEKLLDGISDPYARRELLLARRERARLQDDSAAHLAATKALIADFPGDPAFATWVDELGGADKAAAAPLRAAVHDSIAVWSANAALGDSEYAPADLLYEEASLVSELGSTEEAKGLWSKSADAYAAEALKSPLKVPRAANFGRGDALLKAGRKAEAKTLYESLVKAYPEEFTFNYEYASELNDEGDAAGAYPYAVNAAAAAYGDNWLRAVRLKGALELKLGRIDAAAKTVDEALAQTIPSKSPLVRNYRYVAAQRALRRDTAAVPKPERDAMPAAKNTAPDATSPWTTLGLGLAAAGAPLGWCRFVSDEYILPEVVLLSAGLLIAAAATAFARRKAPVPLSTPLDRPLAAVLLAWALASAFSVDPRYSLLGTYGGYTYGFWQVASCAALFQLTASADEAARRRVLRAALGAAMAVSAYAVLQAAGLDPWVPDGDLPGHRAISTLGSPAFLGAYLVVWFPAALDLGFVRRAGPDARPLRPGADRRQASRLGLPRLVAGRRAGRPRLPGTSREAPTPPLVDETLGRPSRPSSL